MFQVIEKEMWEDKLSVVGGVLPLIRSHDRLLTLTSLLIVIQYYAPQPGEATSFPVTVPPWSP